MRSFTAVLRKPCGVGNETQDVTHINQVLNHWIIFQPHYPDFNCSATSIIDKLETTSLTLKAIGHQWSYKSKLQLNRQQKPEIPLPSSSCRRRSEKQSILHSCFPERESLPLLLMHDLEGEAVTIKGQKTGAESIGLYRRFHRKESSWWMASLHFSWVSYKANPLIQHLCG